jgi:hypothetical protein
LLTAQNSERSARDAALVGLRAAYQQLEAAAGHGLDVAEGQRNQLRAAQRGAEADQQHGAVPGPKRRVRRGARRNHQAQHAGHRGTG